MPHILQLKYSRLCLLLVPLALGACSGLKEDLGLGRNPPDEFAVVDRPPLSMPPDFTLRPPQPGVGRPQEVDTTKQASAALFDEPTVKSSGSQVEQALLAQTHAERSEPNIRDLVDKESSQKVVANEHLVDKLLIWTSKDKTPPATIVNATDEAARIKDAQAKGEPLNATATPIIERNKSGWLGL